MGEPLGANTLLHGQLNGTENAFTASLPGVHHATPGQVVRFSAHPKNMHFFNIVSGKRI
jgi:sn-glycerol 3-phosphate transport system ATP-binding protein